MKKIICSLFLLFPLLLTGCMTADPYTGERQVSKTTMGAGIGAASGAIIGAIAGRGQGALIGAGLGAVVGGVAGNVMDQQEGALRQRLQGTGVQIQRGPNGDIHLIMPSDITFAFNSADIKPRFYDALNSVSIVLKKYHRSVVQIDGYTDNVGSDTYNQHLSEQRAHSTASYLRAQGVDPNRFSVRGFGSRRAIASNATPEGRAQNRRVEITIHPIS